MGKIFAKTTQHYTDYLYPEHYENKNSGTLVVNNWKTGEKFMLMYVTHR